MSPESNVPNWLFERLDQERRETAAAHSRLRSDFNAGFDRIRDDMMKANGVLASKFEEVSEDVLTIKVERRMEAKTVAQRSTWIALLVSGCIAVLIRMVEFLIIHK